LICLTSRGEKKNSTTTGNQIRGIDLRKGAVRASRVPTVAASEADRGTVAGSDTDGSCASGSMWLRRGRRVGFARKRQPAGREATIRTAIFLEKTLINTTVASQRADGRCSSA
jgi:hypothetical protein